MAETTYTIDLPFSVTRLWNVFNNVEKWVPLLESYISHEIISETESIWTFKVNMGIMKKKISTKIKIIEWEEQKKIALYVTGINEKFNGSASIETMANGNEHTTVHISQHMEIKGTLKVMMNSFTKAPSNKKLGKATEDIINRLLEIEVLLKKANVLVD